MFNLLIAFALVALSVSTSWAADCSPECTGSCKIKDLAELSTKNMTAEERKKTAKCLDTGNGCCDDPCTKYLSRDLCVSDPKCLSTGASYVDSKFPNCFSRDKMCISYDKVGCNASGYCTWGDSYCVFNNKDVPSSEVNCPALHPFVIAMIVMIFLTLIAGVIIIIVMVIIVRKRRDEEDRIEEEKNAEAAIQHSKIHPQQYTDASDTHLGQAPSTVGAALAQPAGADDFLYSESPGGYTGDDGTGYAANTGYDPNDPNNYDANAYADYQGYDTTGQEQQQQEPAADIDINEDDY